MIKTCPSEYVLRQFNDGRIDDLKEIDRITEHLGICESCIDKLESMTPGPIAEGLRNSLSSELVADETDLLDEDLQSIQSSLDMAMSRINSIFPENKIDLSEYGENRYQVLGSIGEGDFSCVFGALTTKQKYANSDDLVGIKIPHPRKLTSYLHMQQFLEDCQQAQSLVHPGIQKIIEFGQWDEKRLFLSKPLIQHPTLTRLARKKTRMTFDAMMLIFNQIVDAVNYAHENKVIHRHLSPDNIHIVISNHSRSADESPKTPKVQAVISDFGFVLDSRYHFDLVEPADSSNPFVSPESATLNADFIDNRTDIYSMGKILKLLKRLTEDLRNEEQIGKIIKNSTCVRRRDRYQTVSELKAALDLI